MFPPEYERLPKNVHFKYNGEKMVLSEGAEEVMGFYAAMLRTGLDKYLVYLQGAVYKARKLVAYKTGHLVAYNAKVPSLWVRL